jgi:hypothetical protein
MARYRPAGAKITALVAMSLAMISLAACTQPDQTVHAPTATAAPSPTPVESPPASATPSAVEADPGDVTTWTVTAEGIGPLERNVAYADSTARITGFDASELCPGVMTLSQEGAGHIALVLGDDGASTRSVWVTGRAADSGSVPESPSTANGIRLGSSMSELAAAYPDLEVVAQIGADAYGYAVGDDTAGWIDFIVEDETVVTMGSSERARAPREMCG